MTVLWSIIATPSRTKKLNNVMSPSVNFRPRGSASFYADPAPTPRRRPLPTTCPTAPRLQSLTTSPLDRRCLVLTSRLMSLRCLARSADFKSRASTPPPTYHLPLNRRPLQATIQPPAPSRPMPTPAPMAPHRRMSTRHPPTLHQEVQLPIACLSADMPNCQNSRLSLTSSSADTTPHSSA